MEPGDLSEVKRLHEQCFPVRYDTVSTRTDSSLSVVFAFSPAAFGYADSTSSKLP